MNKRGLPLLADKIFLSDKGFVEVNVSTRKLFCPAHCELSVVGGTTTTPGMKRFRLSKNGTDFMAPVRFKLISFPGLDVYPLKRKVKLCQLR